MKRDAVCSASEAGLLDLLSAGHKKKMKKTASSAGALLTLAGVEKHTRDLIIFIHVCFLGLYESDSEIQTTVV